MTITRKLRIGFLIMCALIVAGGIIAAITITAATKSDRDELGDLAALMSATASMRSASSNEIDALRAELLTRSTGANYSSNVEPSQPAIKKQVDGLQDNSAVTSDIRKQLDAIAKVSGEFDSLAQKALKKARAGDVTGAVLYMSSTVQSSALSLQTLFDGLNAMTNQTRMDLQKSSQSRANSSLIFLLGVLAVETIAGLVMSFYYPNLISRSLRDVIRKVRGTASELLASAGQLAAGAAQTSTAVSETAATVDEVERTTRAASETASDLATRANDDAASAEQGRQLARDLLGGMRQIEHEMSLVAESVVRLGEQLETANAVIDTSSDIAEQSNVLAVNAAIEAAKAAEHSRSFGVVADEMHNLAQQSKAATVQVREIIAQIQKATIDVVNAAERSNTAVSEGTAYASKSNEAFESIYGGASNAAQSFGQVAGTSQQQFTAIEQIVESMSSIESATSQVASSAQHMRDRATDLTEVAEELHRMIEAGVSASDEDTLTQAEPAEA